MKKEEFISHRELSFPKNERAFNFLGITDAYFRKNMYYFLFFERLELRVETVIKDANGWRAENDTFLEDTSESYNPIIESKFIGKKPKTFAKRYFGGLDESIYEWEMKKGKWALVKEKIVQNLPPWAKKS